MRNGKQHNDDGLETTGHSNLKKMFSSHVQENILLHKERSDLDFAKVKKLRELNHNESVFLRKYEKYAVHSGTRRSSVDIGSLRSASRCRSRAEEEVGSQKSLGRLAISNQCPYSLDSWNMMVDVDKRFLEENKANLLRDDTGETRDDEEPAKASPVTPRDVDMTPASLSRRKSCGNLMPRRHTLTPLAMKHGLFEKDDDTLDEEIVHIQAAQKPARQRRHSLYPLNKMPTLPNLPKRRGSVDPSQSVLPKIRGDFKTSLENLSKSDPNMSTALHEVKEALAKETESGNKGPRGVLKNKPLTVNKPVATAAIFVRDENGNSERIDQDDFGVNQKNDSAGENSDSAIKAKQDCILPAISESPLLSTTPDNRSMKSVSFQETPTTDSPVCHDILDEQPIAPVRSRRNSLGTVTLQYMVDTHHGAAKLRYVARLVREMEREAGVGPKSPEEDKTFAELQKCRYLRTPKDAEQEN